MSEKRSTPAPQTERHVFRCWQDDLRGSVIHPDHTPERCRERGHHCNVCHLSFDDPIHQPASEKEE